MSAESTDRISAVSAASNCSSRALPGLATRAPWQLFAFAGAGACAGELASQPLDLVKTRMQLQGQVCVKTGQRVAPFAYANSGAALVGVLRQEGPRALWAGLPPAILRSLTYGSLRVGLYEPFKGALAMQGLGDASSGGGGVSGAAAAAAGEPSLLLRGTAGALSGGLAAALCCPADVLKVRLQSAFAASTATAGASAVAVAAGLPHRPTLASEAAAVVREGGLRALYRGWGPTTARAALVAAVELAGYEEARGVLEMRFLLGGGGGTAGWSARLGTHLGAALAAGLLASLISSPLDVARSRLMPAGGGQRYGGVKGVLAAAEGAQALWSGVPADFARRAPHTVANYAVLEALRERWGR